jgi:hypothetical protein
VDHTIDEINNDQEYVLTFKDTNVLDEDEDDVLENVNLQNNFKQRMALKRRKQA